MNLMTVDEKNDLDRLNRILDIYQESQDRPGTLDFGLIWQAASDLRKELYMEIGKRISEKD